MTSPTVLVPRSVIPPLAIIGGGNMAQAIVRGGIDAGVVDARSVAVCEPDDTKLDLFRKLGVRAVATAPELARWMLERDRPGALGQLLIAVKPQSLAAVGTQWRSLLEGGERIVVSILAGATSATVRAALGGTVGGGVRVVRVMPNTPASVRKGCSAIALGAGARAGDEVAAMSLFASIGRVVSIDESLMDAFTAIAGSGPAYVFYLAEAMTRAGVELGFDPATARDIARWTVEGAGVLLGASERTPEELRAAVTSKGGTTAAATTVLDARAVMTALVDAMRAARDRGAEIARSAPAPS